MEKWDIAFTPASAMAVCDGVPGGENIDLIRAESMPVALNTASAMTLLKNKNKHKGVIFIVCYHDDDDDDDDDV